MNHVIKVSQNECLCNKVGVTSVENITKICLEWHGHVRRRPTQED